MLNEHSVEHTYREYTRDPLSEEEIRDVLGKLKMTAREMLRSRDASKADLTGEETDEELVSLMAQNPRLLQRPIGVVGDRAVMARPAEALLELL